MDRKLKLVLFTNRICSTEALKSVGCIVAGGATSMHYGMHILGLLADRLKSKWLLLGNVSLAHQLWEKSWSISAKVEKSTGGVVMEG